MTHPIVTAHKSASFIGEITFKSGNRTRLWIAGNRNTGDTIVFQQTLFSNSRQWNHQRRVTGRNIAKLATELNHILNEGEASWGDYRNDAALDVLKTLVEA